MNDDGRRMDSHKVMGVLLYGLAFTITAYIVITLLVGVIA